MLVRPRSSKPCSQLLSGLVGSNRHYIETESGHSKLVSTLVKVTEEIGGASFMTPKGQAGLPAVQRTWFNKTALNPVLLDTAGTLLVMFSLPWVSQLPPSPTILKALW